MENQIALIVLNKDEQKNVAIDIFSRYPKAQKVLVASDGQAFITDDGDAAAKNHSRVNRYKKELSLTPFTRDELEADVKTEKVDVKTAENAGKKTEKVDVKTAENAGKKTEKVDVKTAENAGKKTDEAKKNTGKNVSKPSKQTK